MYSYTNIATPHIIDVCFVNLRDISFFVCLFLKEDEGVCREMCGRIVGEWVRREAERLAAEALEETEKDKDHNSELL